ncbi:hypothetical protein [Kribbella catacumbae]|uniref:hypothetical protein n=1 Tax=Kribbella catacumbae TaxID=460086 RepID=UPI000382585A|nr:hypothetical protein [Kribbella catacumbae]
MTGRAVTVDGLWAERLGVEDQQASNELGARFEFLSAFVLDSGEMPPAATAEFATAYGDLLTLEWFLADVRRALTGGEVQR